MSAYVVEAEAASSRLRNWLISGAIQAVSGADAGAVAGSIDRDGRAHYYYPEITGYYLHWLAEARESLGPAATLSAQCASTWAARAFANNNIPATRIYPVEDASCAKVAANPDDWRNRAVFFFDLAMLLRGLAAAHERELITEPDFVVNRLLTELARFINADGDIFAARARAEENVLPERWSTAAGGYEAKACAAILTAGKGRRIASTLMNACQQFNARQIGTAMMQPINLLHPTLYFAEGLMYATPFPASEITHLLSACLVLMREDGCLPETETSDQFRCDVTAQALRIGILLRARSVDSAPNREQIFRLASALFNRVRDDGSLPCHADDGDGSSNVWSAIFAEQALRWFVRHERGLDLPAARWIT
ncbi:MAG: hypothetical protein IPP82_10885 [Xanthomonadales bacterium]|nr:hypothetical protein [Xanthomonadales bacterium]